ncbi:phosphopantetheine adenylyltransferase [Fusobacterium necrophorum subsp. funduliforme 1_1_36S]|nr:phosphopantetheine adenylyltransferase [Fusobacterium necrophorum subsp. funduliforme 1_1_36S]
MRVGIYAGSFDPITKGHQDIIRRALNIVDRLIVLVVNNPNKNIGFILMKEKR